MPKKSLKKFLISAGTVSVLAPAALAATVIMHRGNGDVGLGNTLQDAVEKVLLFGDDASPRAASVANDRSSADNSAKGQIPLGAGPYLSGSRLADLMRYHTDFSRLDLGDEAWPGKGAHGAAAGAVLAALADLPPGQKLALASAIVSGGHGGMPWSGSGPFGGGAGAGGSGGLPGAGGSGGSGSGPQDVGGDVNVPPTIPGSGDVAGPAVAVVPLPATVWMLFAALGALGIAALRNGNVRALRL